jgi:hypothetical protein
VDTRTEGPSTPDLTAPFAGYSQEDQPLAGYAVTTGAFSALFGGAIVLLARRGRLPDRIGAGDVLLVGVGTHKLSRLIGKERVTSFLRAPFTEYQGKGGPGEVEERARGRGLRRAIGELLICPYCLGQWIAGGFAVGLAVAPRLTRLIAATLAAVTISDVLQIAYKAAEEKGLETGSAPGREARPGSR